MQTLLTVLIFLFFSLIGIVLYGICIERYLVRFKKYRIHIPNLPAAFNGFIVIHISDVHLGPLMPYWFIDRIFRKVNALDKDIILCTGDYVLGRNIPSRVNAVWTLMGRLKARYGVFSVLGNCDHWADSGGSLEAMRKTGQDTHGKARCIEKEGQRLWIAGAGDLMEDHIPLDSILSQIPKNDCRIVIAHNPDSADTEFQDRIDLMLAGHTHGRQVVIPFSSYPKLHAQNPEYTSGLKTSKKNQLVFISKGIGWGVFPIRLNCLPEIPIIELVGA